jgi:hypothetical protein
VTILEVGFEGGSIAILASQKPDGRWEYRVRTNESAMCDMLSEEDRADLGPAVTTQGKWGTFCEALRPLDHHEWYRAYPLVVHPEFREVVLLAVRERGGIEAQALWRRRMEGNMVLQSNSPATIEIVKQVAPSEEEWRRFTADLALCVTDLSEDDCLIISAKKTGYYVQFAAQGRFGTRAEAMSNAFAEPGKELSDESNGLLQQIGWNAPNSDPVDGSPNFFRDFPARGGFDPIANLAVETLRRVFKIKHPGQLQYKAFSEAGGEIRFPTLRLKREP